MRNQQRGRKLEEERKKMVGHVGETKFLVITSSLRHARQWCSQQIILLHNMNENSAKCSIMFIACAIQNKMKA
jgi:hypothetical protein